MHKSANTQVVSSPNPETSEIRSKDFLGRLKSLLGDDAADKLHCCIVDLAENGVHETRFSPEDRLPNRQDITQFLASWFKSARISADDCREWLIDYATTALSSISSSSTSRIRHSTKSNIKYIYNSDKVFDCECEENVAKACCTPTCPVYEEMSAKVMERKRLRQKEEDDRKRQNEELKRSLLLEKAEKKRVKKENREKARKRAEQRWLKENSEACEIARKHRLDGLTLKQTAAALNDANFRSPMGHAWTNQTVRIALVRYDKLAGARYKDSLFSESDLRKLESKRVRKRADSRNKKSTATGTVDKDGEDRDQAPTLL